MHPIPELTPLLKQLRLSGILDSLEARNREAIDRKLVFTEFLSLLIHDEVARRDQKKLDLRMRRANFRNQKTLEGFDFDRLPGLNRAAIHDLATCRFIEEKAAVLIAGPCGTGKSHLAQALGHAAARQGYDVLFITQTQVMNSLRSAQAMGNYDRRFAHSPPPRSGTAPAAQENRPAQASNGRWSRALVHSSQTPPITRRTALLQQRLGARADVVDREAVFAQQYVGRCGRAEALHAEHVAARPYVTIPALPHA